MFERYPAFTQTFCVREIEGLRRSGLEVPIFSIRSEDGDGLQKLSSEALQDVSHLPDVERLAKNWLSPFAHHARRARRALVEEWGRSGDRNRAYEAVWLGPRLAQRGVGHVHVHFAGVAARTAFWLKKFHNIEFSITAHANDFFVNSDADRLTSLFEEAKFVVTVSDYSVQRLADMFPVLRGKVHRVYNGIDTGWFSQERKQPAVPTLLGIGRLIEKKGFMDLIEACGLLNDLDFRCLIVGEGPLYAQLEARIQQLGLSGKVYLLGPKTECEIKQLLAGSTIFALACCTESDGGRDNLPTVIMEAMAASLPVVSTRLAGVPEMVAHGESGLLCGEGDVPGLAANIRTLLGDPEKGRAMGLRGRQLAAELFDSDATTRGLVRVFREHQALPQ